MEAATAPSCDLESDTVEKVTENDDHITSNVSEVKINLEACGVSDTPSSHNTPSPSMDGSNSSFTFSPDRIIEETLQVERSFMQYVMSIPLSPGRNRSPAPMMVGLDHLDNLCRLMEQLSELREQNSQLKKRVAFLEDIKCLQEMHNHLIKRSCICHKALTFKPNSSSTQLVLPSTSKSTCVEFKSNEKDFLLKGKPKRISKKVDIVGKTQSLSTTKKIRKSRERSKSVSYADELLPKKQKVSKWVRVKEALTKKGKLERMNSAHDTLLPEDSYNKPGEIHECRSEDSGIVHLDEATVDVLGISKSIHRRTDREPSIEAESFLSDASTITPLNSSLEDFNREFFKKKGIPLYLTPHASRQNSQSSEFDIRERKKHRNVSTDFVRVRRSSPTIGSESEEDDGKPPLPTSSKYKYAQSEEWERRHLSPGKDFYGKKSNKTTWRKMKDIMHPKRSTSNKKSKKSFDKYLVDYDDPSCMSIESIDELDDRYTSAAASSFKMRTESLESSEILSPEPGRCLRSSSSPRIISISQSADASPVSGSHKKSKPKLTINIPPESSPPPSRKSRWTKVKQVFIGNRGDTSGTNSAPASPHYTSAGTTFYVDLEALAALGDASGVFSKNLQELKEISSHTGLKKGESSKSNILSFSLADDEDISVKSHTWERKKSRPAVLDVANLKSHSVSPASSSGSRTINVSDSFNKKLRDWERKRSVKEASPILERKGSGKEKNKREKKYDKDKKEYQKIKLYRYKKEKDSLNKDDSKLYGKGEITIQTTSGKFRFEGISDEFTRKLLEWEAMQGYTSEYSTLALLDSHHTRSQSMKEAANSESPKSKRPRCRSEGSLLDISQNSVERKPSTSSRERKRSSSVKPMELEKTDSFSKDNVGKWIENNAKPIENSYESRPRSHSWKLKYRPVDYPASLLINNQQIVKEKEMLEIMIADLHEQLEKLELYGERITLEKGILEAASLQRQHRYDETVQQLRHELHHLRQINLKLLQQLAKSDKYSSLKYMDMWKSTHDVEKIYECSLQLLHQLKDLLFILQQNTREFSELQWYVLQYQANIVLLQNQVHRQSFQLESVHKSYANGIRRRWNTYSGLDAKFYEPEEGTTKPQSLKDYTFFYSETFLPRLLSPMIHHSTINYGLKLEKLMSFTRDIEIKLHHIIRSPGSSKHSRSSENSAQTRKKKTILVDKSSDSTNQSKFETNQLYSDCKKSDALDFSLITHSVELKNDDQFSLYPVSILPSVTSNIGVTSATSHQQFTDVKCISNANTDLTGSTAVVTMTHTITSSTMTQESSTLVKPLTTLSEKHIHSIQTQFPSQSLVAKQTSPLMSTHNLKSEKHPTKLGSPKQRTKNTSTKTLSISEPVKTRVTITHSDKMCSNSSKIDSPTLTPKGSARNIPSKSTILSVDENSKKKSQIPVYYNALSPIIPARSPRRLKGEPRTEPPNLRTMNVTPPASIKRKQYASSKSTTTSKTLDEETGEIAFTKADDSETKNTKIIEVHEETPVKEQTLDAKLTCKSSSEPFLLLPSSSSCQESEEIALTHSGKLNILKMEFLSTESLPPKSLNLKLPGEKSESVSSASSGTLHAASTELISMASPTVLLEKQTEKAQITKEYTVVSPKGLRMSGSPSSIRAYLSASRESSLQLSPPVTPKIMRRYPEGDNSLTKPSKLKDLFKKKNKKKKQSMGTVEVLCQQTLLLAAASPEIKSSDNEYSLEGSESNLKEPCDSDIENVEMLSRDECPSPESDVEKKQEKPKSSIRKFFRLNR